MSCGSGRLEEYLDGELDNEARRDVEDHLAGCADCRAELGDLKRLEEVLRSVAPIAPPEADGFVRVVRERSRRRGWIPWAASAAAAAVVLLGLFLRLPGSVDIRDDLAAFARSPSDELETRIRRAGSAGLEALEDALEEGDRRTQFAAAVLLFKHADDAARERVLARFQGQVDVRKELVKYASDPTDASEARIRASGPVGMAVLEAALNDEVPKVRFAAAALLFKLADAPTRDWVLAHFGIGGESNGGWTLGSVGTEEEDLELIPIAVSALEAGGGERWAMDVLRKLHRLNVEARREVAGSVATLLKHSNPRVQKLALDVVKELGIEFPLSAIVDLLDSPDLGDEALKVLRQATGRDFGRDREGWLKAIEAMEEDR